jgi:predicted MPP superfamily phosphohydrolase
VIVAAVILWTLTALVVGLAVWGLLIEPQLLEVTRLTLPLPRLPEDLRGFTIGHLSDMHLRGNAASRRLAERACAELLALRPELICLSGDVVDHAEFLAEGIELLRRLAAPLGVFLVLGNHDCDATMEDFLAGNPACDHAQELWREALRATDVTLLDNEARALEVRGRRAVLVGIGDLCAGQDDLPAALREAPAGDLRLLLCHSPDAIDLPEAEWADLVMAGHTHGGQMQIPGIGAVWAPVWRLRHRASGLLRLGQTLLFVSRGLSSGLPARINCRPQVALLELVPGDLEGLPRTHRVPPMIVPERCEA